MKLLGIGNSFSDDSFDWWLYPILRELLGEDEEISINNMYIGGCSIDTHVKKLLKDYEGVFTGIVPVGTVIQNARSSEIGDNLTRDGFHLSYDFGRYIAALTWSAVLTGKDISNIEYAPYGVDAFRKRIAIRTVQAALKAPFEITKVSGKE